MVSLAVRASSAAGLFAAGNITAALSASRTSGPAPLAVLFDAAETTHVDSGIDTFRELGYSFNFGDPTSGTWEHSGQSKNVQRGGPLAVHVFETPGTYTVKVRVRDANGDTDQTSVVITVSDADDDFSATTYSLSRNTTHTGAPVGATLVDNITSWGSYPASNRRLLLQADQDFSSLGTLSASQLSDFYVDRCGTGADPIVSQISPEAGNSLNYGFRKVFRRLNIQGRIDGSNSPQEVLFHQCFILGSSSNQGISIGTNLASNYAAASAANKPLIRWAKNTFFIECEVASGASCNMFNSGGRGTHVLGCEAYGPVEHNLRFPTNYKAVIAHNYLHGVSDPIRHNVKLHSKGTDDVQSLFLDDSLTPDTRHVVIANNLILAPTGTQDNNQWCIVPSPQSGSFTEGVRDVIIENNVFSKNSASAEIAWWGINITQRGNTMLSGTLNVTVNSSSGTNTPGWNGPYFSSTSAITTADPT